MARPTTSNEQVLQGTLVVSAVGVVLAAES